MLPSSKEQLAEWGKERNRKVKQDHNVEHSNGGAQEGRGAEINFVLAKLQEEAGWCPEGLNWERGREIENPKGML